MSGGNHGHDGKWHPGPIFYAVIAVFLGVLTFVELGPLFDWYNLPTPVLIVLSIVKFVTVVAFFMHLANDEGIFTQVFVAPLFGGIAMVGVLMTLAHTFMPSPYQDFFPVAERSWEAYNGECQSWLTSHVSNRFYCASPAIPQERMATHVLAAMAKVKVVEAGPDLSKMDDDQKLAALMEKGKVGYEANCLACHQATGAGVPGAFPPLAGSDYITDGKVHASVIVKGLNGEITVNGTKYNGVMASFGALSDFEIAAIATYERNSWGNKLGIVLPEDVKSVR